MRRTYLVALFVLGLALMSGALVMAEDADHSAPNVVQGPGGSGPELLDFIINESPYTGWGTFPADRWNDFGGYLQSGAPHGATVRIFANDVALDGIATDEFDGTLPYGSIVVKENFMGTVDDPGEVAALTVMYKLQGFNVEGGEWFWLKAAGDGSAIDLEGAPEGCVNCHGQDGNADGLLRYAFGAEPVSYFGDPLPEANGAAIIDYVLNTSPYTGWDSFPDTDVDNFPGPLPSGAPHGNTVRIFANDRLLDALERDNFDGHLPYGSLVVKENWTGTVDAPGELAALTIMYKVQGYNPDGGDWYWIKASGDGSAIDLEGAPEGCINCHGQDDDWLLRFDVPEGMHDDMMGDDMGGAMGIDANAVIDRACTICHTRERVDNASKDADGWAATIDRMIDKGAPVSPDERRALIDFLAQ